MHSLPHLHPIEVHGHDSSLADAAHALQQSGHVDHVAETIGETGHGKGLEKIR